MLTLNARTLDHLAYRLAPRIAERPAARPRTGDVPPDLDRLLNEAEAAKLLGLRQATLCTWRSRGRGPRFFRLGLNRKPPIRYKLGDLLSFRDGRATDPEDRS